VVHPLLPEAAPEDLERLELGGAAGREHQRAAVLEPVLPQAVQLDKLELLLQRAAGLAEQVAHDSGQQRVGRGAVPLEPFGRHRCQGPAELADLHQGHVVAQLGQAEGAGQTTETAADHHHPGHGRTLGADAKRPPGRG